MNRSHARIAVAMLLAVLLGGCAEMRSNPIVIKLAARSAGNVAATHGKMSKEDIQGTIHYLDLASEVLTSTMPPDFSKAREMVKHEAPPKYQVLIYSAVDLVEVTVGPELESENPDAEKTRQMIVLAIEGFKEGMDLRG